MHIQTEYGFIHDPTTIYGLVGWVLYMTLILLF